MAVPPGLWPCLLAVGLSALSLAAVSRASSLVEIPVEHSLGDGRFVAAGVLIGEISRQGGIMGPLRFARNKLSKQEVKQIQVLLEEDRNYRIRLPGDPINKGSAYVMASLRTRCLAQSGFEESLHLELTEDNRIVGLDYQPANGRCDPLDGMDSTVGVTPAFSEETTVLYRYPSKEPTLSMDDIATAIEEEGDLSAGVDKPPGVAGRRKGKKEKTWVEKNWMFLLAGGVILMQVLGSVAGAEGPGGEGGAAAGQRGPGRRR
eukprot:evm.model.scf_1497.3 EVM.evm.TU.scf_1497.3   scf_1497:29634-32889(-)